MEKSTGPATCITVSIERTPATGTRLKIRLLVAHNAILQNMLFLRPTFLLGLNAFMLT
jgi:hypothetical protein